MLGSSTFAVGAMLKGSPAMLPVMLIGRLLFGSGNGSLTSKIYKRYLLFRCEYHMFIEYYENVEVFTSVGENFSILSQEI